MSGEEKPKENRNVKKTGLSLSECKSWVDSALLTHSFIRSSFLFYLPLLSVSSDDRTSERLVLSAWICVLVEIITRGSKSIPRFNERGLGKDVSTPFFLINFISHSWKPWFFLYSTSSPYLPSSSCSYFSSSLTSKTTLRKLITTAVIEYCYSRVTQLHYGHQKWHF